MLQNSSDWIANASCTGKTHLFFGPANEKRVDKRDREKIALKICFQCPVMHECRQQARENGELGIWGGETEEQRFEAGFIRDPWVLRNARARKKRLLKKLQSGVDDSIG